MDIKKGDLVMVVRPKRCCGDGSSLGIVGVVLDMIPGSSCCGCGNVRRGLVAHISGGLYGDPENLKKIDPPADGDSLPTRKDLEVAA